MSEILSPESAAAEPPPASETREQTVVVDNVHLT
jgi:hypothetical protein